MMEKKILIGIVMVWILSITTPSAASPLYAGYNGQSLFWIDTFYLGIDNQFRWWVRVPLDLLPGSVRIIFKYESTGAISTELVLFLLGITGQPDLLFGVDTNGQTWGESYQTGFASGYDNTGATWTEQEVLQFVGSGSDNLNNLWWFITFIYQDIIPFSAGMNISLLSPEPPEEEPPVSERNEKQPSTDFPSTKKILKLTSYLKELSRNDELLQKLEQLTGTSLDPTSLLTFAEEEIFTPKRREALSRMIDN
jgi:hypothetical protein